ncbi:homoserine O-acetyltransferase MetX [Pengzhenrongella sicca]|uniref:Homoserine O-acetyltransferase n=1 Tax=Pengzhenrongella sicca TaxID=2819238 RepID=A0A8A4ZJK1_9MICO|nr:homoserine O-acetyltransferase [Pengzhenrongella sicca]QTE29778.1 homoserine O-acetyltransferase [Pengzhenrongella sicca]
MSSDRRRRAARPAAPAPSPRRAHVPTRRRVDAPAPGPIPASAAWREGDEVGRRQFVDVGPVELEAGERLPAVRLAYETWGTLSPARDNAVLVMHALTGDSHVTGAAGPGHPTAGWWSTLVGPGAPIDTDRYFVVVPNVLGGCQGSTGPASTAPDGRPWGGRFPHITVRDQVAVEVGLTDALGIDAWALVVGGSLGGLRALEWAASNPSRVRAVAAIATSAQTSGDQIANFHTQIGAIRADPRFADGDYYDAPDGEGPHVGLGIARQIAHASYRSARELDERFGRIPQAAENPLGGGRFAVQSYLDHHGDKLARRFDANTYVVLTRTMITHDLGRDRGGVDAALAQITARALVVAVDSDRLFPPSQSDRIAAGIPGAGPVRTIRSTFGHDGFLIETDQIGPMVEGFLAGG